MNAPRVLGESEQTITIEPFSDQILLASFPPNTTVSMTLYISNTNDIPYGTPDTVKVMIVDWTNSQQSTFELTSYNYGKYIENYPIQYIYVQNGMPATMILYFQYIIKEYYEYSMPVIEDLTQLQTQLIYITEALIAGTNFKYTGPIANMVMSNFPIGTTIYQLDIQVYSTSSTAVGNVSFDWSATFSYMIQVGALGVNEDANLYTITCDSTTQKIPTSVTSTNAVCNWIAIEYFSPLNITYTQKTYPIVYNSATNTFGLAANTSLSMNANSSYLTTVAAPFTVYKIS